MRKLSATLQELMSRNVTSGFFLVKLGPNKEGTAFRYTSLPYDFTYDGEVYYSNNGLSSLDPPRLSDILDKEAYRITIVDPQYALKPFIEGGGNTSHFTGSPLKVVGGLVNVSGVTEFATDPGGVYPEFMTLYQGRLDEAAYSITLDEEVVLNLSGSSPVGSLDISRTLLTSKTYLQDKYPGDTSFDQVYEGSESLKLLWGKKV